jgi:hypothetical protein
MDELILAYPQFKGSKWAKKERGYVLSRECTPSLLCLLDSHAANTFITLSVSVVQSNA